jgi:hypothetical protein
MITFRIEKGEFGTFHSGSRLIPLIYRCWNCALDSRTMPEIFADEAVVQRHIDVHCRAGHGMLVSDADRLKALGFVLSDSEALSLPKRDFEGAYLWQKIRDLERDLSLSVGQAEGLQKRLDVAEREILRLKPGLGKGPLTLYDNISCSNCGQSFGPGYSGFSHCEHHAGLIGRRS